MDWVRGTGMFFSADLSLLGMLREESLTCAKRFTHTKRSQRRPKWKANKRVYGSTAEGAMIALERRYEYQDITVGQLKQVDSSFLDFYSLSTL